VAANGGIFGRDAGDGFVFDEMAGPVDCFIERSGDGLQTSIQAPRSLSVGKEIDIATVAAFASLDPSAVATGAHHPLYASVGLPFVMAELVSLDELARARPTASAFTEALTAHHPENDFFSLFLYVRDAADPSQIRARMFAPLSNIPEDPATGSAAAALAGLLAHLDGGGDQRFDIVQGVEMGRRSDIVAAVTDGRVRVGGPCVPMQRGTLDL
jgi:trans-2,3-dihydro-3-hydroxyanthranilate isomerase